MSESWSSQEPNRGSGFESKYLAMIIVACVLAAAAITTALILRPSHASTVSSSNSAATLTEPTECLRMTDYYAARTQWQAAAGLAVDHANNPAATSADVSTEATHVEEAANAVAADPNVAGHLREAASHLSQVSAYVATGNYADAGSELDQVNGELNAAESALAASAVPAC